MHSPPSQLTFGMIQRWWHGPCLWEAVRAQNALTQVTMVQQQLCKTPGQRASQVAWAVRQEHGAREGWKLSWVQMEKATFLVSRPPVCKGGRCSIRSSMGLPGSERKGRANPLLTRSLLSGVIDQAVRNSGIWVWLWGKQSCGLGRWVRTQFRAEAGWRCWSWETTASPGGSPEWGLAMGMRGIGVMSPTRVPMWEMRVDRAFFWWWDRTYFHFHWRWTLTVGLWLKFLHTLMNIIMKCTDFCPVLTTACSQNFVHYCLVELMPQMVSG